MKGSSLTRSATTSWHHNFHLRFSESPPCLVTGLGLGNQQECTGSLQASLSLLLDINIPDENPDALFSSIQSENFIQIPMGYRIIGPMRARVVPLWFLTCSMLG